MHDPYDETDEDGMREYDWQEELNPDEGDKD